MKSASVVLGLAGLLLLHGCERHTTAPEPVACPQLVLQAPAGALQDVATVTLTVTGPDMDAINRSMNIQGNQATLTLPVPAGEDRTFTVTAKDAQGTILATGSRTVDLAAGSSPTVTIALSIPTEQELIYDDGQPSFQWVWLNSGEGCGVRMTSPQYPATLLTVSYYIATVDYFGAGDGTFSARVLGFDAEPGTNLTSPLSVTPATTGWVEVDLSERNVQLNGEFVVGMFWDGVSTPAIGYDDIDNGRAWDYAEYSEWQWVQYEWTYFMRATVMLPTGQVVELPQVER